MQTAAVFASYLRLKGQKRKSKEQRAKEQKASDRLYTLNFDKSGHFILFTGLIMIL